MEERLPLLFWRRRYMKYAKTLSTLMGELETKSQKACQSIVDDQQELRHTVEMAHKNISDLQVGGMPQYERLV